MGIPTEELSDEILDLNSNESAHPESKEGEDYAFFSKRIAFFCAAETKKTPWWQLKSKLNKDDQRFAGDFRALKRQLFEYTDFPMNQTVPEETFKNIINQLILNQHETEAGEILNAAKRLEEKVTVGLKHLVEQVVINLCHFEQFTLAPFQSEKTRHSLIKFTQSNDAINYAYLDYNEQVKHQFSLKTLEAYHHALTGKIDFDPVNGGLAPTDISNAGIAADETTALERMLTKNPDFTQFLYGTQEEYAYLAEEYNDFLDRQQRQQAVKKEYGLFRVREGESESKRQCTENRSPNRLAP